MANLDSAKAVVAAGSSVAGVQLGLNFKDISGIVLLIGISFAAGRIVVVACLGILLDSIDLNDCSDWESHQLQHRQCLRLDHLLGLPLDHKFLLLQYHHHHYLHHTPRHLHPCHPCPNRVRVVATSTAASAIATAAEQLAGFNLE